MASNITPDRDFIGIGFGPMHLSLACYFSDKAVPQEAVRFFEKKSEFSWHSGLQFAGSRMQTPFLKDLASMRDPGSPFTFLSYLKAQGRLEAFIDNRILYPTRAEYEHYLRWAALKLENYVDYHTTVEAIEPIVDAAGRMVNFKVFTPGGTAWRCRSLSVAAGLSASYKTGACERVVQVSDYEHRIVEFLQRDKVPGHVLVVGAGQSAAEVALDLLRRLPQARVCVASRGFVFRTVEANPFVNGLFCESAHRDFRQLPLRVREHHLDDLRLSNYGAVDESVIAAISRLAYDESVSGLHRLDRRSYCDIVSLALRGEKVAVEMRDTYGAQTSVDLYDLVIDSRGFNADAVTKLLAPLNRFLRQPHLREMNLDANYTVADLDSPVCKLFIHGYASYLVDTTIICNIAQRAEAMGRLVHA
jgi:lysine/ornithine N-monooxygenase